MEVRGRASREEARLEWEESRRWENRGGNADNTTGAAFTGSYARKLKITRMAGTSL